MSPYHVLLIYDSYSLLTTASVIAKAGNENLLSSQILTGRLMCGTLNNLSATTNRLPGMWTNYNKYS